MRMLQEFKQFAMRGNVVDLAVGFILGGAFQRIVSSLGSDVIMPPIGYLINRVQFNELKYVLGETIVRTPDPANPGQFLETVQAVSINYGAFIQSTFDFLIIAFCAFLLVKAMNNVLKKKDEGPKSPDLSTSEKLLVEIRDLLKGQTPPMEVPSPLPGEP